MEYRPREKKRHPGLTLVFLAMLAGLIFILAGFVGILVGYIEVEIPDVAERFKPTPTPTRPAVLYIADGDTSFAEGRLQDAIAAYEQAISLDPSNDVPYIRQSRLLVYTNNTAKAVDRAAQAVLLNPTSPENLAYYCRALDWEAQYSAAFDACSCAIELDPTYAEGYAFLSEVYADRGEWGLARSTAQQAIEANYNSMDAHHNMGYALEVQGHYKDAKSYYEDAIKLAPNLSQLYIDAGRVDYWLGDSETAAERFKQAIRLNPLNPEPYSRLGWNYYTDGDYSRAIDALEQGLGIDPTYGKGWGQLGLVYYTRQNFEEAIKILPKAIELSEGDFLRRARQIEIHAEVETLTGPDTIPVLRGKFTIPDQKTDILYTAQIEPVPYEEKTLNFDQELSCAASVVNAIKNPSTLPITGDALHFTQAFSQSTGTATLNLATGSMLLDIRNLPRPERVPYELIVRFWPNREDNVGYIQPDSTGQAQINIQFEEKLQAPLEYYYTLGLAYAYMDPPICDKAVPWLLASLERDSSGYNPAWYGLRICPSASSPPTPVPTFTPIPTPEQ